MLAIYFSHNDIDAAQNDHHVGHGVPETEIFQHREIYETRRANAITIRIRSAVADQIETEFTFGASDPSVGFTDRCLNARIFTFGLKIGPG